MALRIGFSWYVETRNGIFNWRGSWLNCATHPTDDRVIVGNYRPSKRRNQSVSSLNLTQPTTTGHYSLMRGPGITRCVDLPIHSKCPLNRLRMTCSPEVNRLLFDLIGNEMLNSATEGKLLSHIHIVAVKGLHKEVHQQIFHSTHQVKGESITKFLAKLRTQAKFCSFTFNISQHG